MKIIVTGGAGFIGSHLVDAYLEQGHEVLILDNLSSGKEERINPQAKFEKASITDENLIDIFESFKPDIINHHAAQIEVRTSVDNPQFDAQINILGSINLLEAAKKVGTVKKVLFASSGGAVYGDAEQIPTTEESPVHPISPYGISKLSTEHYLYYYHQVHGLPYTALRYSNVYGPRQNPHGEAGVVAIFFERLLSGKEFVINGTGEQSRDFVFVKDVVAGNLKATSSDFVGNVNICTSKETTIKQLVQIMSQAIGHTEEVKHGPAKAGEQQRSCLSFGLAQEKLDWQPQMFVEEGLQITADYFKQVHS